MKKIEFLFILFTIVFIVFVDFIFYVFSVYEKKEQPKEEIKQEVIKPKYQYIGIYKITHYCDCEVCTLTPKGSKTATGKKPVDGITIACDGKILKMGDVVYIEGYGKRICQDRGGAIKHKKIDVFVSSHSKAKKLGIKNRKVYKKIPY